MLKQIKRKKNKTGENDNERKLAGSFGETIEMLKYALEDCPDIITRKVCIENKKTGYFIYVDGLVNTDLVQRDFISPILDMEYEKLLKKETIENLPVASIGFPDDYDTLIDDILLGNTVFMLDGCDHAISASLIRFEKRNIEEPVVEKNIKGPHDGFVESIKTNMSLLRRHIKNPNLKFKMFRLGTTTNQTCVIAYMDGIANPSLLKVLSEKIESINFDGLMGVGYIEQFICDHPNSPFPQYQPTERPDKVVASLLEGRFAIMLDGTPVASIVPVSFFSFFQATDDYNSNWMFGTFLRMIRILGAIIAVFLPGIYISILTFHYYTVPLNLLISLAESRAKVPFQPVLEALIMELTLELLREATIRLPTYIGTAVGVVGGLIIGQAAVQAGIVSNLMVIVVALTAIASFVIPIYDMGLAIRLIRFVVMILSAAFGVIGIVVAAAAIMAHLVALESLGQPYFQPWIPFKLKDLKDSMIRLPTRLLYKRPDIAQPVDKKRGSNNE